MDRRNSKFFTEETKAVGKRIAEFLKLANVSQNEIATECFPGINNQLIYRRFAGLTEITIGEYIAICKYLKVEYDLFLNEETYTEYAYEYIKAIRGRRGRYL